MPRRKKKTTGRIKGEGIFDGLNDFLKRTKILSSVGNVLAPLAGSALGTFVTPGVGTAVGAAVGSSLNEGLKSLGYGRRRKGKGQMPAPFTGYGIGANAGSVNSMGGRRKGGRRGIGTLTGELAPNYSEVQQLKGLTLQKLLSGGDSRLAINPKGQRLMGRGNSTAFGSVAPVNSKTSFSK